MKKKYVVIIRRQWRHENDDNDEKWKWRKWSMLMKENEMKVKGK